MFMFLYFGFNMILIVHSRNYILGKYFIVCKGNSAPVATIQCDRYSLFQCLSECIVKHRCNAIGVNHHAGEMYNQQPGDIQIHANWNLYLLQPSRSCIQIQKKYVYYGFLLIIDCDFSCYILMENKINGMLQSWF